MATITRIDLRADDTGTIELVCERTADGDEHPVRSFVGDGEFGLLVDGLEPNERIALFVERDDASESTADSGLPP